MRLCSVSVDLDEIPNYYRIHGLEPPEQGATVVYDWALKRLDDWATSHDLRLTLFAVGADVLRPESAARLRWMAERGHEIANHSLDHRYDFSRLGGEALVRQIAESSEVLENATGAEVTGFRAPGYVMTDAVYRALETCEVAYSSSLLSSPLYYSAKALSMAAMKARGRVSASIVDSPRVLRAPTEPYRVGQPYWTRGRGVLELPVSVTPVLRVPYIGTTLTLAGPTRARWLTRMVCGQRFVNLELHGIDVLDELDELRGLVGHQPDVTVPLRRKFDSLNAAVDALRAAGYGFQRLREAAGELDPGRG